jgi:tetratricopeptide (TPR) repeat protein
VPAVLAVAAFAMRKRAPLIAVGLVMAIIPIAPVSGIVIFDYSYYSITSDHYLYLPMLGVSIAVVALLRCVPLRAAYVAAAVSLCALGTLACIQARTWRTQRSSVEHTLMVNPRSFSSYSVLAVLEVAEARGDLAKLSLAETYARKALEIRPGNARSLNMLANVLAAEGRFEEALTEIDRALVQSPNDPQYHLAKAGILGELHRGEEAIQELRVVLRFDPDHRLANELVQKWDKTIRTTVPASQKSTAAGALR